ncbi:hypothetical protein CAPTEDRAFT_192195 [Capitella teleta]|uniref:Uncharacterized protein n=1 Tax=Capitella teleta TaxID=283909 RepID=R7TN20_CAPTE|nr:hypothetical protein CAPTEDRAFT_192195 [Capitella teleta]|eukprot:ELT94917.1 hypothetical protein CAPTEDRAFT_192195 [Capitella teleta]
MATTTESSVPLNFSQCVRSALPRSCWKRTQDIYSAVKNVQTGFKPSLIFDFGAVNEKDIEKFVCTLNQLKGNSYEDVRNASTLSVAVIGMDVMIWNVKELIEYLSSLKSGNRKGPTFVDVSSRLNAPLVRDDMQSMLLEMCDLLLGSLQEGQKTINLDITPSINVTSVFGLCLGYPVIYWYEDADANNCLSMVPLVVNKIYRLAEPQQCVYSFSYPQCLAEILQYDVDEWFHGVNDGNSCMTKTVNVNPVICL